MTFKGALFELEPELEPELKLTSFLPYSLLFMKKDVMPSNQTNKQAETVSQRTGFLLEYRA